MYAQNGPPVYANGAVVMMNPPGRQGVGNGAVLHPMPPTMINGAPGRAAGGSHAPAARGAGGYTAMPSRQDRFLPVIHAQRPPFMQAPGQRKSVTAAPPYMGVYGTRQVFAPQLPLGPAPGRGASAPRVPSRGFIPIHPPGSTGHNAGRRRPTSSSQVLCGSQNNERSQTDSFTSNRRSFSTSRSGTIVVPFHGQGSADPGRADNRGCSVVALAPQPPVIRLPQPGRRHAHPPQQQFPSLVGVNSGTLRTAPSAPLSYDIGSLGGSGRVITSRTNDAGDIFTPLVEVSQDDRSTSSSSRSSDNSDAATDSSQSVELASMTDSSPTGQYALSAELAANLNQYEESEVNEYLPNVYFCGTRTCSKVCGIQGRPQNNGYDDDKNHYIITVGDHLGYQYEIQKELGRGTFGVVVRAYDHKEQREVAAKIIKNKPSYTKQAKEEVDVLLTLQSDDPNDEKNIVRILKTLTFRNHFIIIFELLSIDLYNMVYKNGFRAMPMEFIYDFAEQMLTALAFVQQHNIVHCDFKPENIVVCHETSLASRGTNLKRLKLIDFGSACFNDRRVHTYIQSRYYRAPEVVLGIPYTSAIDMWSFGCVVCELANGYPIFPGSSEGDLLQRMVEYLGHVPKSVQAKGKRSGTFYEDDGAQLRPKLGSMASSAGVVPAKPHRFTGASSKSLANYLQSARADRDDLFLDFVSGCLQLDPEARLTATNALRHPWLEKWRRARAARKGRGR